jgi:hypothetical protein
MVEAGRVLKVSQARIDAENTRVRTPLDRRKRRVDSLGCDRKLAQLATDGVGDGIRNGGGRGIVGQFSNDLCLIRPLAAAGGINTLWGPITDSKPLKREDFLSLEHGRERRDPTHPPDCSRRESTGQREGGKGVSARERCHYRGHVLDAATIHRVDCAPPAHRG